MKRFAILLLALVMLLSLCACGEPDSAETSPSTTTDATETSHHPKEALQPLLDKRKVPELKTR